MYIHIVRTSPMYMYVHTYLIDVYGTTYEVANWLTYSVVHTRHLLQSLATTLAPPTERNVALLLRPCVCMCGVCMCVRVYEVCVHMGVWMYISNYVMCASKYISTPQG